MTKILLELFKGTGSAGKSFKKITDGRGRIISVDNEAKYYPDVLTDILNFDYTKIPTPDFIWASPPCSSFTNMALTKRTTHRFAPRVRNVDTMKPLAKSAVIGDKILKKTIEIINYFFKKNKKLRWVMENPHGSMWRSPLMKKLPEYHRELTLYCLYDDKRKKPTDFFSNVKLELKTGKCNARVDFNKLKLCDRYKIPQRLLTSIFKQLLNPSSTLVNK